jgi:hypothetical protein
MNEPEWTKEKLLAQVFAAREELETTLARVPEQEMGTPILHDGWSVQDTLCHLAFWQELATACFAALRAGQTPDPIIDVDALNARILTDFRHLSLEEVREREQAAYQQVLDMIESATEDELFDPGHFTWTNGNPFLTWIENNTWGHYAEHLPELQAWLYGNVES